MSCYIRHSGDVTVDNITYNDSAAKNMDYLQFFIFIHFQLFPVSLEYSTLDKLMDTVK